MLCGWLRKYRRLWGKWFVIPLHRFLDPVSTVQEICELWNSLQPEAPQVAADISVSSVGKKRFQSSVASEIESVESTSRHHPEIPALNEHNRVDIKEKQALTSAASCNVYCKNSIRIMP